VLGTAFKFLDDLVFKSLLRQNYFFDALSLIASWQSYRAFMRASILLYVIFFDVLLEEIAFGVFDLGLAAYYI